MAAWIIGQPSESALVLPGFMKICNDDAISIVSQLPPELLEHVPELTAAKERIAEMEAEVERLRKLVDKTANFPEELVKLEEEYRQNNEKQVSGAGKYQCPYCSMFCVNQGSLASHIKRKHPAKAGD
jgi:hypothetical protein